jgi:hypothetical protein
MAKTQKEKFEETARQLETDESEENFDRVLRRVAMHADERVFRLWPIEDHADDRNWQASALKPTVCWVRARNAEEARAFVQQATIAMVAVKAVGIEPVAYSPWVNPRLTGCAPDDPKIQVPEGIVVTADGQTLTVE